MQVGMQWWPPTSQNEPSRLLLSSRASVQPLRPATPHLQLPHSSAREGAAQLRAARLHRRHLLQQALRQALQLQRNLRGEAVGKSTSHKQPAWYVSAMVPGSKRRVATTRHSRFAPGAAPGSTGLGRRQGHQLGQDHPARRATAGQRVSAKGRVQFRCPHRQRREAAAAGVHLPRHTALTTACTTRMAALPHQLRRQGWHEACLVIRGIHEAWRKQVGG